MEYKNFKTFFLKEFPEYDSEYKSHIEFNEEFLPHVFIGDTLCEDLLNLLESNTDKKRIKNIFSFMERMAIEGDSQIQELLVVTILERLGDDSNILHKAYVYMGTCTKHMSDEIETFWGRKT